MSDLNIEKFNPTVSELQNLVAITSQITEVNIKDKSQIEQVKKHRISLRDARVAITKKGKELREDALSFQKAVIAKEKELIAIIEPEEERLKVFEEEAKKQALRAERIALLPERKKAIEAIADELPLPDDEALIAMDATEFKEYCNGRVADKNAKHEAELKAREDAIKAEEERQSIEKEAREREEKARQEERERIEREQKEEKERLEREQKAEQERIEQAKKDEEARLKREQEEREADIKYQKWLSDSGYNKDTDVLKEEGNKVVLYRKISEFEK